MTLFFFGSFEPYSAAILQALIANPSIKVVAVVTTPPAPQGRRQTLTKNSVHSLAETHHLPVLTPNSLKTEPFIKNLKLKIKNYLIPDFLITAGYGKLLPPSLLNYPTHGCLNLHFSLLPKYRGANPAEWALLLNETQTGISLIQMTSQFDQGPILAHANLPITLQDNRQSLYQKLYSLGAKFLPQWLLDYPIKIKNSSADEADSKLKILLQPSSSPTPPAKRFTRNDGFIDWKIIQAAQAGQTFDPHQLTGHLATAYQFLTTSKSLSLPKQLQFLDRVARALYGFPSLWTNVTTPKSSKRLKIHSVNINQNRLSLDQVQLEGLPPTPYNQIKNQIPSPTL